MTGPVWDEDDEMVVQGAAVTNVAGSAGGTYTATEQGIINNLVTTVNAILAVMRRDNTIAED